MNGDVVAHELGELKGVVNSLVSSQKAVAAAVQDHGEKLAVVLAKLENLPCDEHEADLKRIRWSFVKLAMYLIGAGGVGGGIATMITKLWGG